MAGCGPSGIEPALLKVTHETIPAKAYDLGGMRHRHTAIDQADGLANLERVEPADTARSPMCLGDERNRPHSPNLSPISAKVSSRARSSSTILALRRALSMVTLSRRKSGKRPGAGGIASVPLRASVYFFRERAGA